MERIMEQLARSIRNLVLWRAEFEGTIVIPIWNNRVQHYSE